MDAPKAIETRYKGYRFRSRLEARWAVFFDTVGIKYEYENEGFDLGEAGYYLPDFWLPTQEIWIEIKSQDTSQAQAVLSKLDALAKQTGFRAYALFGQCWYPDTDDSDNYLGCGSFPNGACGWGYWWTRCTIPDCGYMDLCYHGNGGGLKCHRDKLRAIDHPAYYSEILSAGYDAARAARFEHGERG